MKKSVLIMIFCVSMGLVSSGCMPPGKTGKKADEYEKEISTLMSQINEKDSELKRLMDEKESEGAKMLHKKEAEMAGLEKARQVLLENLNKEITEGKAKVEINGRGLVVTFLSEIFFEPGRDVVGAAGKEVLQKVGKVLNNEAAFSQIAVEGHTDNDPIKYSGWRSNWELSSARALSVLHMMIDECAVKEDRLSAVGNGSVRPVADNSTPEGKKQNRRVELVIFPPDVNAAKTIEPPVNVQTQAPVSTGETVNKQ